MPSASAFMPSRCAVRRAPQVMVKVTVGVRGMVAIAAHLRYISKDDRLTIEDHRGLEREGKEATGRAACGQASSADWRCSGPSR